MAPPPPAEIRAALQAFQRAVETGVVAVRFENGYVTAAYHVRNPEKLSHVERETALSR